MKIVFRNLAIFLETHLSHILITCSVTNEHAMVPVLMLSINSRTIPYHFAYLEACLQKISLKSLDKPSEDAFDETFTPRDIVQIFSLNHGYILYLILIYHFLSFQEWENRLSKLSDVCTEFLCYRPAE